MKIFEIFSPPFLRPFDIFKISSVPRVFYHYSTIPLPISDHFSHVAGPFSDVNPLDYVYRATGCKMQILSQDDAMTQYILQYIHNTKHGQFTYSQQRRNGRA